MNGAESLVATLISGGVEVCFTNPGTSEMHFVSALDRSEGLRCLLCLFEGVATGAADGYGRMAKKPAATLLHLGPGMANGLANLHNAKKARTPMVNIVGDHATYHRELDAPLTSDIEGAAWPFSDWVRTAKTATSLASDAAEAINAARQPPGAISTLILPADTAWNEANGVASVAASDARPLVSEQRREAITKILRGSGPTLILMSGQALEPEGLLAAGRIAEVSGAEILAQTSNPRLERGAGRVMVDRLPYVIDLAIARLARYRHIVLVGAKPPVGFFAYPGKPGVLQHPDCEIHRLAEPAEDAIEALEWLAQDLGAAPDAARLQPFAPCQRPSGRLNADSIAAAVSVTLSEGAIVADEAITLGRESFLLTAGAKPHSWLQIVGGAIGIGLPLALGAAVACPDRKVLSLQADGSAMYTLQALWTQARENLDVTTVILSNRGYATLVGEMSNLGLGKPGPIARDMFEIDRPGLDWVALAKGLGVDGVRVEDAETLTGLLEDSFAGRGPRLIEAVL